MALDLGVQRGSSSGWSFEAAPHEALRAPAFAARSADADAPRGARNEDRAPAGACFEDRAARRRRRAHAADLRRLPDITLRQAPPQNRLRPESHADPGPPPHTRQMHSLHEP